MDSCLIICAPKLETGAEFVRPLRRTGFFHESLSNPQLGVELLHPTAVDSASFPIWLGQDAERVTALVPDRRLQNVFQSPSRNQGLMFLKSPAPSDLRLTFEGQRYHYVGVRAEEFNSTSSLAFRGAGGNLERRLLREAGRAGENLTHWEIATGKPNRSPDIWMNPLILRIHMHGDACAPPPREALPNDTRAVFAQLLRDVDILGLVPAFTPEDDARCRAWRLLLAQLATAQPSAIERLVLGGASPNTPQTEPRPDVAWAFTALDALGGHFSIDGHGQKPSAPSPLTYGWNPHPRASANTRWFGEQLVHRWNSGSPLIPDVASEQPPRNVRAGDRRGRETRFVVTTSDPDGRSRLLAEEGVFAFPQRPFAVAPRRYTQEELTTATQSLTAYLRTCADWLPEISANVTLLFFERLMADLDQVRVPTNQALHRRWFRVVGGNQLATDVPGLLNDLSRTLVAPRSALIVHLPQPTADCAAMRFNLVAAVPGGARALVWGLLRDRPAPEIERTIPLTMGWWNTWHLSLFDDPAGVHVRFRNTRFELGLAKLGKVPLGGGSETRLVPETPIRFSVPL